MRSWRSEPYLWVHLAGIAVVPIFLELCSLGLAASERRFPALLVFLLVAVAGISPIVWMQWQRPFYIFSLSPLVLKPAQLTEQQRRLLRRFKAPLGRVLAITMAFVAIALLWQLQQWVPATTAAAKIVPGGALGGLLLAAGAFLLSNLFLQVPASVLAVLVTPETLLHKAEPYPVTDIASDFSLLGFLVKQILPPIAEPTSTPSTSTTPPVTPAGSSSDELASSPVSDRATKLQPETVAEPEDSSDLEEFEEPEVAVSSAVVAKPVSELEALEVEAEFEAATETDAALETELTSEGTEAIETSLEPALAPEPIAEPETSSEPEPEPIAELETNPESESEPIAESETSSKPAPEPIADSEISSAAAEPEETNWDEPEPMISEEPIVSASGIIEAEMVEAPIEAETVKAADTETDEAPIEMLATLENPIELLARLEDPSEAPVAENPFTEAAAELSQIEESESPHVQDTVVAIIPDTHGSEAALVPDSPVDLPMESEQNPNVEDTVVTIVPNADAATD